jgi:23S rRNA (uracil1939-C5)-methyltransferase
MPKNATSPRAAATQTAETRIEKLVYGGEGLARIEGEVVLAPYVLPGELVTLETRRVKTGLLRGSAVSIQDDSPQRVTPRCPYFGSCGGCQYQHADYAYQLEQKVGILRETLRRLGGLNFEDEIHVLSGEPWFYRNRIQLHSADG